MANNQFTFANDKDRFMRNVSPEPNSGCWLWTASLNEKGYAQFKYKGKMARGHRVSYEMAGRSIPPGLQLDHKCRVRCCVNPDHLEPVTNLENSHRGESGKQQKAKTHCPSGHPYSPENTYVYRGGRGCLTCRAEATRRYRARKI